MENMHEIIKFIIDLAKNMGINKNNYSFNDCLSIFDKSKKLEQYLDKVITSPILEEEFDSITSEFVKTILRIYIDKKGIEVINKKEEIESNEETLDKYIIYERYVSKFSLLNREQERELFKAYNNGDEEAKKTIIMCNQRLVKSIAKGYVSETYDFMTAIQDGNLGLLRAIQKFDVSLGYRFSTFATVLIHQAICTRKLLETHSLIAPINAVKKLSRYNELCREYIEKHGKPLDDKTAASLLNISIKKLQALKNLNNGVVSLNQMVNNNDDDDTDLLYFIKDDKNKSVEDQVMDCNLHASLKKAMNDLTDREKFVLVERFGLEGKSPKSLEEVGVMLNVTRERVRKIQKKALAKLRHPSRGRTLKEYLYK